MNPAYNCDEWRRNRKAALERDGYKCVYCWETVRLAVHHIRPLRMGGTHAIYNLITVCRSCHDDEHQQIRMHGLHVIPGPYYEPYRYELTDQDAVLRYADALDAEGLVSGDRLRELEALR